MLQTLSPIQPWKAGPGEPFFAYKETFGLSARGLVHSENDLEQLLEELKTKTLHERRLDWMREIRRWIGQFFAMGVLAALLAHAYLYPEQSTLSAWAAGLVVIAATGLSVNSALREIFHQRKRKSQKEDDPVP